eukprot:TRINITY_DN7880_c0_g1_i2.p1 TRINITY_DN7880_c0_g1~~TRINITY_DN7880_c0_g1_i2.p1  ORF type:complete len:223 (-),score=33.64 TRINITY_DN7880_c0_g1_i2:798-1466(-)
MRAFLLLQLAICATALPAYFGFWGADLSETSEFTNLQFGPNATELVAGFRNGVKGLYAMRDVLYEGNKLRKDYQDRLAAAVPEVKALLENGTIIGIFMGDELIWNCMSDEDLHQGVDAVRAAFPRENGTIIWQNEAAMRPPTYTDHCGRPHLSYKIPEGGRTRTTLQTHAHAHAHAQAHPHPLKPQSSPSTLTLHSPSPRHHCHRHRHCHRRRYTHPHPHPQ